MEGNLRIHPWLAAWVAGRTAHGAAADRVAESGVVDGAPPQLYRVLHIHVPAAPATVHSPASPCLPCHVEALQQLPRCRIIWLRLSMPGADQSGEASTSLHAIYNLKKAQ